MSAVAWTVRTSPGGKLVHIEYNASKGTKGALVHVGDETVRVAQGKRFEIENVKAGMSASRELKVETGRWEMSAKLAAFPFAKLNPGKLLLDIKVVPTYDVDADPVAPHGLLGQSYDGDSIAVDGKTDSVTTKESTTTAEAEGAIEGRLSDYKMQGRFGTAFKFSRFDAASAPRRNVSALSGGKKFSPTDKMPSAGGYSAPSAVVEAVTTSNNAS
jgi:hypothetical protein